MWDFNRSERKALLLATGLIGLAALGRLVGGADPGELAWVAAWTESRSNASSAGEGSSANGVEGLRENVERALGREERALTPLAIAERLDPNDAPEEELRRLPGIGPARARAILEERSRGRFESAEALLRVPGIGPATYARIAPFLTVEGQAPEAASQPPRRTGTARECGADGRVDPNTATETELRGLPGIGPVLARRIVQSREEVGLFAAPDALLRVSGIGPRLLERLRDRVCVLGD